MQSALGRFLLAFRRAKNRTRKWNAECRTGKYKSIPARGRGRAPAWTGAFLLNHLGLLCRPRPAGGGFVIVFAGAEMDESHFLLFRFHLENQPIFSMRDFSPPFSRMTVSKISPFQRHCPVQYADHSRVWRFRLVNPTLCPLSNRRRSFRPFPVKPRFNLNPHQCSNRVSRKTPPPK